MDEVFNSYEVIAVAGIEVETVGVCRGCDEQVRESAARLVSFPDDRGDYESVAAYGRGIELERLQLRLDFLQPSLPFRRFVTVPGRSPGRGRLEIDACRFARRPPPAPRPPRGK